MPGTKAGGAKTKATIFRLYGEEFYKNIGSKGGKASKGGFHSDKIGRDGLTGRERASIAGRKAGKLSKRGHKYLRTEAGYRFYVALDTGNVVRHKHDD